ncbi:MAG: phosphotransferase family protein [Candidatus Binataceae bacterium]
MTSNRNRAIAAAMGTAAALDLTVDDAIVLQQSNKLAVRLLPCDVLARVAEERIKQWAEFEVELALRLAQTESPVAALEPRVAPGAYVRDGFVVTLWTYYEPVPSREFAAADYAHALERLHDCMRHIDLPTPHFTDRITDAQRLIANRDQTPELAQGDRELLSNTLQSLRQAISARGGREQLLHGEPHPGNVLRTKQGLVFIDLETCCRGPVEFDLAYVPEEVSVHYRSVDQQLLRECRILMLAMVAAWRWDRNDQFPNRRQAAQELLSALRQALSGAPFSTLLPRWPDT